MDEMDRPSYITDGDWDIIKARFERLESDIAALARVAQQVQEIASRADQRGSAHQPFIDRVRAGAVGEGMTRRTHTYEQELADAILALRQMSGALEDLVRRGTK